MKLHLKKASSKHGMLPGTVVYIGDQAPLKTSVHYIIYDRQNYEEKSTMSSADIKKKLDQGFHVWVDIHGLKNSNFINDLCNSFDIHPLIIEDIFNTHQRPKVEKIEDALYLVLKLLNTNSNHYNYKSEQISLVNRENLTITVRESPSYDLKHIKERLSQPHSLVKDKNSQYLLYLFIDSLIDDYFKYIEATGDTLEHLENLLITKPEKLNLQELYTNKRRTTTLRKIVTPLRDIVHLIGNEHQTNDSRPFQLYYKDLHDHCVRMIEQIDLHREISSSMLDVYLSIQNNRMNETMKILTLFASIFIPLSFIASLYGMNFEYMPELKWHYAYPGILLFMACLAGGMLTYFKRKRIF